MATAWISTNTELALINALTQSVTLYLPQAPANGQSLFIKDATGNSTNSTITVVTQGSDTYENGSVLQTLNSAYESLQLVYNSNIWYVNGGNMYNTFTVSSLTANIIQSSNLSSANISVSSLQFNDVPTSTIGIFNSVSSFLYYNGYNIGGGLRTAIPQGLNNYNRPFIFNPNTISNLSIWFDASVSTSMAVSTTSTILFWNSLSTARNVLTVSTPIGAISNVGLYAPNSLNNLGGVRLSTTYLATNNLGGSNMLNIYASILMNSEFTSFYVINQISNTTGPFQAIQIGANWRSGISGTAYYYIAADGNPLRVNVISGYSLTNNSPTIYMTTRNGGTMSVRLNGSNTVSSNYDSFVLSNNSFFYYFGTETYNLFSAGNLHEVLHYRSALSITDITRAEGYLAWKWGLQSNLNSAHPYRYVPPY